MDKRRNKQISKSVASSRHFTSNGSQRRQLTEALEYQRATSEVLKIISRSSADLQPLLDTIAEAAQRLCRSEHVFILLLNGGLYHLAAAKGATSDQINYLKANPIASNRGSITGRV